MTRIKTGVTAHRRHKKVLKLVKGRRDLHTCEAFLQRA
jgi:ribosomal protein L20